MKSKVEGHPNLVKNVSSGVIDVSGDNDSDKYRTAKRQALMNIDSQQEIARLSNEIDEIKSLLLQLVNK